MNHRSDRVEDLKEKILNKMHIKVEHQRLIYGGKQLEDGIFNIAAKCLKLIGLGRTLESYRISQESTIFLVLRLLGGL